MYKFLLILSLFLASNSICLSAEEGTISSADGKIYYQTFGKGKPILIINGGPGMNSNGFVSLAKQLSARHQTIVYDQRGTGKSTLLQTNSNTIAMNLMVADIEKLRKHLKIEKWIILGHSFGGMLASYYATIYPETIEKLILSSSGGIDLELQSYVGAAINGKLSTKEREQLAYWNSKISNGDTTYATRLQRGKNLAAAYVYDRKNIPLIAQRLTEGNSLINSLVWQNLHTIKFNCTEKLKSFNQPVLIIQGKQDIIAEKTAIKASKAFKNSKIVLMDHCVHYGWLDNAEVYFKEIERFLST